MFIIDIINTIFINYKIDYSYGRLINFLSFLSFVYDIKLMLGILIIYIFKRYFRNINIKYSENINKLKK